MSGLTIEKANYILENYHQLTFDEIKELQHYRLSVNVKNMQEGKLRTFFSRSKWLSDDPEILNQLDDGYVQFLLRCANRILSENPDKIFFNLCPVCSKLARTPFARQCRLCGFDWH